MMKRPLNQAEIFKYIDEVTGEFDEFEENEENESEGQAGFSRILNTHTYDFIKTYLYALHKKKLKNPEIKVIFFNAIQSYSNPIVVPPVVTFMAGSGLARIENDIVHTRVRYGGRSYYVCLNRHQEQIGGSMSVVCFNLNITGANPDAAKLELLYDTIYKEALLNSVYKGKTLRAIDLPYERVERSCDLDVEIVEQEKSSLDDIFLPEETRADLKRFVECVKRHAELKTPVKYLLSGPPGTAKTRIIKAIASECAEKATVLFAGGGMLRTNLAFDFASLFEPCILCIDDLDLSVGDRRGVFNGNALGAFLQKMDGFLQNNVFVLATTNDKKLVDLAASRPGRFDLVLDVGALDKEDYLKLVKKQTDDAEIVSLFTPEVLSELKEKKIVGAFIVNLVKQLVIAKKTNGKKPVTAQEMRRMIERIYKGFYQDPGRARLGFEIEGGNKKPDN
jgi:hypothetical protein